jgi:hypothetical protein
MRFVRYACVPLVLGCAGAPVPKAEPLPPRPVSSALSQPDSAAASHEGERVPPERAVAEADGIYRDQLAVPGRDERFSTDRQVAALERAIALYRQFLERAGDDPRFSEAVKRSRDRIADAQQTIEFLRSQRDEP